MPVTEIKQFADDVTANVEKVIVGKRDVIEMLVVALLCEGHVLLEDVPGVGKTMLARALALTLGVDFRRLQCTPDLLPSDITGVSVFNQETRAFQFLPGPAFTHILLADEINRATPRAQAALLEAMGERQVTVDGETRSLLRPFLVLATQNPIDDVEPAVDGLALPALSEQVWDVHVDDTIRNYIVALIQATRQNSELALGASPRGSLALYRGAQARAAVNGRDYVLPDDVQALVPIALPHRCIVRPDSALRGRTAEAILAEILEETPLDLGEAED